MMFLTRQPLWLSGGVLIGLALLLAVTGPILVRRRMGLERLVSNNEIAGFKFATVGVLYAVLLAFAVIVVWEKFSAAENVVAQEAGAVANLYRLARGTEAGPDAALHAALTDYVRAAIDADWPAMGRGKSSPVARRALDGLYAAVLRDDPHDPRGAAVLTEILYQLDLVSQARRSRIVMASGAVPGIVWLLLFTGGVLTVGFTFFFGAENLRAQVLMAAVLAFLIFSELLIIVAIDYPFTGSVRVRPEALTAVTEEVGGLPCPPGPQAVARGCAD